MKSYDLAALDRKFSQAFGCKGDCATAPMKAAIDDWFSLYFDREVTDEEDPGQRLPCLIVQKLTRAAFAEYEASAQKGFYQNTLEALNAVRRRALQLALIGGEAWLKPVPDLINRRIYFTVVRRDKALVLARNSAGEATEMGLAAVYKKHGRVYTHLEKRRVDAFGQLILENQLYESASGASLGLRVPLGTIGETAGLRDELRLPGIGGLGLVEVRLDTENCVDGSAEGVSIYAPAAGLIHQIYRGERQLNREFELGAARVFASADLLRRRGRAATLPEGLFVGLDDDPATTGLTIYSPKLREQSFLARKAEQLRNLESLVGLKRGLLGPVEAAQRTATEVTSSEGDYAMTIAEVREAWQQAAEKALRLAGVIGHIYRMNGASRTGSTGLDIHWGDDLLNNR